MIHLPGIDHKFQFVPTLPWEEGGPLIDPTPPALFELFLLEWTAKICPDLVAEEASQPDPQAHKVSVARGVAEHFGIPHQFCDPNPTERLDFYERAGISEEQDRLERDILVKQAFQKSGSPHNPFHLWRMSHRLLQPEAPGCLIHGACRRARLGTNCGLAYSQPSLES